MIKQLAIVVLGLGILAGAQPGRAQDRPAIPPDPLTVKRMIYHVQGGEVQNLATALSQHFTKDEIKVVPVAASGCLLISSSHPGMLEEIQKLLQILDRPPQTILVEVLIAEMSEGGGDKAIERKGQPETPKAARLNLSGSWEAVMKKVQELRRRGSLANVKTIRLTTLENQTGSVMSMERKPYVVGRSGRGGGFPNSQTISYQGVGTSLSVTPQILRDGTIALQLKVNDARMATSRNGVNLGEGEKGESMPATEFITDTLESKLIITPGQAGGTEEVRTNGKSGKERRLILVTARVVPATVKNKEKDEEKKGSGNRK